MGALPHSSQLYTSRNRVACVRGEHRKDILLDRLAMISGYALESDTLPNSLAYSCSITCTGSVPPSLIRFTLCNTCHGTMRGALPLAFLFCVPCVNQAIDGLQATHITDAHLQCNCCVACIQQYYTYTHMVIDNVYIRLSTFELCSTRCTICYFGLCWGSRAFMLGVGYILAFSAKPDLQTILWQVWSCKHQLPQPVLQ